MRTHKTPSVGGLALLAVAGWLTVGIASAADSPSRTAEEAFETRVRPVLADRCWKCHSDKKQSSGLRLDSRAAMLEGGALGPSIVPGDPANSPLIQAIRHDGDVHMPPKAKLPDPQIEAL
ncbi:MAG: c-type cytochrome domain-containing protein, partial [Isosphaeraceae bacterium]